MLPKAVGDQMLGTVNHNTLTSGSRRPEAWPPQYDDPWPGQTGSPETLARSLTTEMLGGSLLHHGSIIVRNLLTAGQAEHFRVGIEQAFEARDAFHAGRAGHGPWYAHSEASAALTHVRPWIENGGGVLTADSPRMLESILSTFKASGIISIIEAYMGERPALSIGKSTLRRVPHDSATDWHQDGAFLGDVRAVNVWIALSPCGGDAPGLDVVGRRLPYIIQPGTHGSMFNWSVGPGMVSLLAEGGAPVESPLFEAGDAMLFDHLMLHRTGVRPGMTRPRWAIESWFFAPSAFPLDQVPLAL